MSGRGTSIHSPVTQFLALRPSSLRVLCNNVTELFEHRGVGVPQCDHVLAFVASIASKQPLQLDICTRHLTQCVLEHLLPITERISPRAQRTHSEFHTVTSFVNAVSECRIRAYLRSHLHASRLCREALGHSFLRASCLRHLRTLNRTAT